MPIAILDPFSGISGDMTLGALLEIGLDPEWLLALPERLGLGDVTVRIQRVRRGQIECAKVDFDIPSSPEPHGRHIAEIRRLVDGVPFPDPVRARVHAAFTALATVEGAIHGLSPEDVHLHEVGAVDAILDVVGAIGGLGHLGVTRVYCGPIALGDGTIHAAHGTLPVPAPATLRLLEGHPVRPGPAGAGELATPTGAALVHVLSDGQPPPEYVPLRSGFGAGARDLPGRPNALRIILAEASSPVDGVVQSLVQLAADVDDMDAETLAAAADAIRDAGALDVVLVPIIMKKGRPGTRLEVLCTRAQVARLEECVLQHTTTLGVRRISLERRALDREMQSVRVFDHAIRVKVATLPDGTRRAKPEFDDVARVAEATGLAVLEVAAAARRLAEQVVEARVPQAASRRLA